MNDYIDCYKKYLTSTFVFSNYIINIEDLNEYAKSITEKEYIIGSKVSILTNILLSFKEEIVKKEVSNGMNSVSSIYDNALFQAASKIASPTDNKYYSLSSYKETPANILTRIRNRLAHGQYLIDFKNNKILINIARKNDTADLVKIDIAKFTDYVIKNVYGYLRNLKSNKIKRHIIRFTNKDINRFKPITTKSDAKNMLKKMVYEEFTLIYSDIIDEEVLNEFNQVMSLYKESLDISLINNFESKINKLGYSIQRITKRVPENEISNLLENIGSFTYENPNLSYQDQVQNLGEYLLYYFNPDEEKIKQLVANLSNLQILDRIDKTGNYNINSLAKTFDFQVKRDHELILSVLLAMFNSMFIYPMENIFINHNEFTNQENTGFTYELLDISLINNCSYTLDTNDINNLTEQKNSLLNDISKINDDIKKIENNLKKIPPEKTDVINKIKTSLVSLSLERDNYEEKLSDVNKELKIKEDYFVNNQDYLKKKSIIKGIRNSISHGHIKTILNKTIKDTIIVFEDIYNGKLTFKLEISLNDFYKFLYSNFYIVVDYLKKIENINNIML